MKTSDVDIGARLREVRILTGTGIITAMRRLCMTRDALFRREIGETKITTQDVRKLLEMYPSLNLNWLFTGEGKVFAKH